MPVWHASVAFQPRRPPVLSWTRHQRKTAERTLRRLLDGVGRPGEEFISDPAAGEVALHMRRPATGWEEAQVGGARDVRCRHGKGLVLP